MEAKHTPGPWGVSHGGLPGDSGFSVVSSSAEAENVKVTAECWPCTIVSEDHRQELFANGRLIAAAPELLQALEEIVAEWDAGNIGRLTAIPGTPGWEESVGMKWAREAIAKATGTPS